MAQMSFCMSSILNSGLVCSGSRLLQEFVAAELIAGCLWVAGSIWCVEYAMIQSAKVYSEQFACQELVIAC